MPEVALSAFPGDAGGLLPNINRWRKQIGLAGFGLEVVEYLELRHD